jgi:DNA-dependent RNA polymerase auxiliary subunit epsilon
MPLFYRNSRDKARRRELTKTLSAGTTALSIRVIDYETLLINFIDIIYNGSLEIRGGHTVNRYRYRAFNGIPVS